MVDEVGELEAGVVFEFTGGADEETLRWLAFEDGNGVTVVTDGAEKGGHDVFYF